MNSQKRIAISACILYIMVGFLICVISTSQKREENESKKEEIIPQTSISVSSDQSVPKKDMPPEKYVLKIVDGIVVVFKDSDMEHPLIVTDIYASSLRNFDRERLSEGIIAETELDMQCMLEDYSS
ncbi:MAG: hypothetical protein IJO09_09045 [Oscillospiraceae bacterium]|nr:hypothetical protein [Oscillospiraceae bacterium]